jgi:hypothetical protein
MPPKAKAKAKAKTRRVLAIDKYAQVPRDMQAVARLLDDRDLVKRTQKALDERHARDDRIDYMPAGGEEVKALAKKVEGMKEQLKGMGSTVRSDSPRRSRSPRRIPTFEPRSGPSTMSRTDRFRAPSLDTFAGMAAKRAVFRDARAASARAALRGRRLT